MRISQTRHRSLQLRLDNVQNSTNAGRYTLCTTCLLQISPDPVNWCIRQCKAKKCAGCIGRNVVGCRSKWQSCSHKLPDRLGLLILTPMSPWVRLHRKRHVTEESRNKEEQDNGRRLPLIWWECEDEVAFDKSDFQRDCICTYGLELVLLENPRLWVG